MPTLTVRDLIEEHKARQFNEQRMADQLKLQREEELTAFRQRLDQFQLVDWHVQAILDQIKRAFERGEHELMFTSFPSSLCTDGGRAINLGGEVPMNAPDKHIHEPKWLATLPKGVASIYAYWKDNLQPGGFGFSARIINYPDGMPGDVGLFFTWPRER